MVAKKTPSKKQKVYSGKMLIDEVKKKIGIVGNSGQVIVPRKYVGDTAVVKIYRDFFICSRCGETISGKDNYSPEEGLCKFCYREREAMKKGECVSCGGPNPVEGQWAQCDKCFNAPFKSEDDPDL